MVGMKARKRVYDSLLAEHLTTHWQMALVSGPRQVGKTTTCRNHAGFYANWDNLDDRERLLAGPARIVEQLQLNRLSKASPVMLFDELHKYPCTTSTGRTRSETPDLACWIPMGSRRWE